MNSYIFLIEKRTLKIKDRKKTCHWKVKVGLEVKVRDTDMERGLCGEGGGIDPTPAGIFIEKLIPTDVITLIATKTTASTLP